MKKRLSLAVCAWLMAAACLFYHYGCLQKRFAAGWIHSLYRQASVVKSESMADYDTVASRWAGYFSSLPGYWPDIYKTWQIMAAFSMAKGRDKQADYDLRMCLHFHPFYPNAYLMLSGFNSRRGYRQRAAACMAAYNGLMQKGMARYSDMLVCTGKGRGRLPAAQ